LRGEALLQAATARFERLRLLAQRAAFGVEPCQRTVGVRNRALRVAQRVARLAP